MFHVSDVLQPKSDERVERVIRQHGVVLIPRLFVAGFLIVFPFFLLFTMLRSGIGGIVFFAACELIGLVMALRAFLVWDADVLVVTTHRLIDVNQHGIWTRMVSEIPLTAVREVDVLPKKGMRLFGNIGSLRIRTSGAPSELIIGCAGKPHVIRDVIQEMRTQATRREDRQNPAEWRTRINPLLDKADAQTIGTIERMLRDREERTTRVPSNNS